jgi:hypothetical protein
MPQMRSPFTLHRYRPKVTGIDAHRATERLVTAGIAQLVMVVVAFSRQKLKVAGDPPQVMPQAGDPGSFHPHRAEALLQKFPVRGFTWRIQ